MPVNTFITANGRIRRRITTDGGTVTEQVAVVTNALGSVVATYKDGWLTADRSYDPYGETRAEWNDVGRFGWVGGLGYRETRREWVSHYVRARHYGYPMGMWTSVDPLWPEEAAFGYVGGGVLAMIDPLGLWSRRQGACKATVITPEPGDRIGVVVGSNGTMIYGGTAIRRFRRGDENCVAVNAGFFGTEPYDEGKQAQPIEDVVDCFGRKYPGRSLDQEKIPRLPVRIPRGGGLTHGRSPSRPGSVARGPTNRTGACTDHRGNLLSLVTIPNVSLGTFSRCMSQICPKGSVIVLLDGGGSTQVVTSPSHRTGRAVHNWIVICSD
jgi:RHS repeat-associated protein